jgi:hypothetical protein
MTGAPLRDAWRTHVGRIAGSATGPWLPEYLGLPQASQHDAQIR